jgi:hypothetical protein
MNCPIDDERILLIKMLNLDVFRSPEYTGSNRCWPCTVFNMVVLGFITTSIGYVVRPLVAVPLAVVGGAIVWLRGYLFPGTPSIGAYVAARFPLEVPHSERVASTPDPMSKNNIDPVLLINSLIDHGVVYEYDDELQLAPAFREQWREEICDIRKLSNDALASNLVDALPWVSRREIIKHEEQAWIVLSDGSQRVEEDAWLTVISATAELAAVRALGNYAPGMHHERRIVAAPPLQSLLERCPVCETPIEETAVDACCGSPHRTASERVLACPECDETVTDTAQMNDKR